MKPVFTEDGVNYVYVQHNNLFVLALTRKNSNVMVILVFLEKLVEVSAGPSLSALSALLHSAWLTFPYSDHA